MAQSLVVSFTTTKVRVAAAVIAGLFASSLQAMDSSGGFIGEPVVRTSETPTINFESVENGDYTITHARRDAQGAPIGQEIQEILNIVDGVVTVSQLLDGVAAASYSANVLPSQAPDETAA